MIALAFLGTLLIYAIGVSLMVRRTAGYCAADLGFIFFSLCFLYTAAPGMTFLFLELDEVPGWPWMELNSLTPTEDALAVHLWRHNIFLLCFLLAYMFVRRRVDVVDFSRRVDSLGRRLGLKEIVFFIPLFFTFSILGNSIAGESDIYYEKYQVIESLGEWERIVYALANRIAAGSQYFMVISFVCLPIKKWLKVMGILAIAFYQLLMSSGSRVELLFFIIAGGVAYALFVNKVKLRYVFFAALCGLCSFWFIEVFRYYEFDLAETIQHFQAFGVKPMGELGAVFSTGFHLYSLSEVGQLPLRDGKMFFFEIMSLFSSNANSHLSPQSWYWREFYPNYPVPPQTNGPIADSALWGLGLFDLAIRACIIGFIFGWLTNKVFGRELSFVWAVIYIFYCATCVMTLKYGVLWQLNPIVKTMLPLIGVYYFYKLILRGLRSAPNNFSV